MPTTPTNSPLKTPFSPVNVPESPLSTQQGQLTGIPRRLRDSAADLFNAIQEWNRLHIDGMNIIHQIKNKKLDEIEKKTTPFNNYPDGLQELCDKLEEIDTKLMSVVLKMETLTRNVEAIKQLEKMKDLSRPMFLTWTAEKYVSTVKTIFEGYNTEAKVKRYVKENIAHTSTKEDIMLFSALWAHQPYIDNNFNFILEAMLKECGHR